MDKKKYYDEDFSRKIKDLSHNKKFNFLREYLVENNYDFEKNHIVKEIFETVIVFFNNRTKWKLLQKARDDIQKLNLEIKDNSSVYEHKVNKYPLENEIEQNDDTYQYMVLILIFEYIISYYKKQKIII